MLSNKKQRTVIQKKQKSKKPLEAILISANSMIKQINIIQT